MKRRQEHTRADTGRCNRQPLIPLGILKELNGQACVFCGAPSYYLVLSVSARGNEITLAAKCSNCHEPKRGLSGDRVVQDIEEVARHIPAGFSRSRNRRMSVAGSHLHARTPRRLTVVAKN